MYKRQVLRPGSLKHRKIRSVLRPGSLQHRKIRGVLRLGSLNHHKIRGARASRQKVGHQTTPRPGFVKKELGTVEKPFLTDPFRASRQKVNWINAWMDQSMNEWMNELLTAWMDECLDQ